MNKWIGVRATLLTPLYYHGVYVPDGSATEPTILTDTAMVFALAATLNCAPTRFLRAVPNYKEDLKNIPWKATLFLSSNAHLMAPVRHIIDADREGGNTETMQGNMASGNFKKTFYVHEVTPGAVYSGALYGPDPFEAIEQKEIIVRMGVGRTGMVQLQKTSLPKEVVLNTATAALFGYSLPEAYRILNTIRPSHPLPQTQAEAMLAAW